MRSSLSARPRGQLRRARYSPRLRSRVRQRKGRSVGVPSSDSPFWALAGPATIRHGEPRYDATKLQSRRSRLRGAILMYGFLLGTSYGVSAGLIVYGIERDYISEDRAFTYIMA